MFTSLSPPPESSAPNSGGNPVNKLAHKILSYDSNIMLAAIISLLIVILFVLLLHIYAKWFLFRPGGQRSRTTSVLLPPPPPQAISTSNHHFHSFAIDATFAASPTKGLEPTAISSIPIFVYKKTDRDQHGVIECAICLCVLEDEETGRRLPSCSHAFHVDCIDMWFHSHSTCPICRSCPIVLASEVVDPERETEGFDGGGGGDGESPTVLEIIVEVPNAENENEGTTETARICSSSSSSSSLSSSHSVKRMMSRNRSERKVHPSGSDEGLVESHV